MTKVFAQFLLMSCLLFSTSACEEDSKVAPETNHNQVEPGQELNEVKIPDTNGQSYSYLALGDSYTIGQSVEKADRWPMQLAAQLQKRNLNMTEPRIIAQTGWTTGSLIRAIDAATDLDDSYDLVSLLIGVNNQYQGRSIDEYEKEYKQLLGTAIRLAGNDKSHVLVLSIPDYSVTPFGKGFNPEKTAQEINEYNSVKKRVTESMGVAYFDITPISRQAVSDPLLIANDGLHPSGKMYGLWVAEVLTWAEELIR